jgi:hypothetical protein
MTFTIHRSILVVVVAVLVIAAGVFVSQRASAASSTPVVYVATGENFPDALGAASAAAVQGGPVLLVTKNSIPSETKTELSRLSPDVIYVAGGTAVVSDALFNELKAYAGSVVRVAGANRYSTAAEVSKSAFPVTGGGGSTAALEARVAELEALLAGVTRTNNTLQFTGMNLQVVNGQGSTETTNSLGNVIVGYNRNGSDTRTGSHMLVIGDYHTYTKHSGIVSGTNNAATGIGSSVTGGLYNTASGDRSSVSGGTDNTASQYGSSVTGGVDNTASYTYSSVTGGRNNTASGSYSSVSGGFDNTASGDWASILGGNTRGVSGDYGTYPFCGCGS